MGAQIPLSIRLLAPAQSLSVFVVLPFQKTCSPRQTLSWKMDVYAPDRVGVLKNARSDSYSVPI